MSERYSRILVEFFERMSSWENSVIAERDISLPQMHLIEVVGNHKSLRMKELSNKLGVTTGTLTVMVQRLLRKGYLNKQNNQQDKRSYYITLTEKGMQEYDIHHMIHEQLIEEIVSHIGKKDGETFFSRMEHVLDVW